MSYEVDTEEYKGYKIKIMVDSDAESPREWDNLGTMICFHKRYNLGDKHNYKHNNYNSCDELEKEIIKENDVAVILPLYLYDHSGITISTNPFSCRWDSGQVGFIFISKDKIRKEYGVKNITKKLKEKVERLLIGEIETYDSFIRGDVYGYIIESDYDEHIDSCWGFYGYNFEENGLMEYAKNAIDCEILSLEEERVLTTIQEIGE